MAPLARLRPLIVAAAVAVSAAHGSAGQNRAVPPYVGVLDEHPAIEYSLRPVHDRVSALGRALADNRTALTFDEKGGYLRSVLNALNVPIESQLLVFSKTGVQRAFTNPSNPRALFFDDSVVVGFIAGARVLEFAADDPEQGVVFYTLAQTPTSKPEITRQTGCLSCHVSSTTLEVPGLINRSMFTSADGSVLPQLGRYDVNHRTPLLQRWGGMYVTGNYTTPFYGRLEHMGNVTTTLHTVSGPTSASNEVFVQWLNNGDADARGYPSHDSDIASLMLFDHQAHAINLLTRLNWEARVNGEWRALAGELADYFLFVGEVPPPAKLTARAGLVERFIAGAPKDQHGRSLRQLDLENRLLRYPCSYMIYSDAFDHLQPPVKQVVYERLFAVLSGRDTSRKYSHLSATDRRAVFEILRDTKRDLPDWFSETR